MVRMIGLILQLLYIYHIYCIYMVLLLGHGFSFPHFFTNTFETKLLIHEATIEINAHCENAP